MWFSCYRSSYGTLAQSPLLLRMRIRCQLMAMNSQILMLKYDIT